MLAFRAPRDRGPRNGCVPASARSAAAPGGRGSTCRSRIRRRARASRRRRRVKLTPSTALHVAVGRPNSERRATKCSAEIFDLEQRGHDHEPARAARRSSATVTRARADQRRRRVAAARRRQTDSAARSGSRAAASPCPAPCPRWWRARRCGGRAAGSSRAGRPCRDAAGCANSASTAARSTISPAYMTATSSQISATTPRSWVIRMMAAPLAACSSRIRSRICAWMVTSSAVVGSSAISSCGSQASAMAIMTRWRMPPESWCG